MDTTEVNTNHTVVREHTFGLLGYHAPACMLAHKASPDIMHVTESAWWTEIAILL